MAAGRLLRTRRWFLVAPTLLVWWIIGQFDKSNISLVIADPAFLKELHMEGRFAELGGLMSTFFIGYGLSILVWGFLVDRFGPRICLAIGTFGWAAVMFFMSRAASLEGLLLARFLLGVAEGNMWPVSNALTNRWFPAKEHSRAQAFWMMGPTLGTALGVPLVTTLIIEGSWRGMMVALAALSLLPLLSFAWIAGSPGEQRGLSHEERVDLETHRAAAAAAGQKSFSELLKSASFWLITLAFTISITTMFTMVQWTPSFLLTQQHLSRASMTLLLTIGYILATAGTVFVGTIGDRTMQRALTGAGTCLAFTLLVLPVALMFSPEASAVAIAALIAVPCGIAALNGALLHAMVRPEAVARATGIYSGIGSIVSAVGPWAFGKLIGVLDGEYWGGFLFLALLNAVGAVCYIALHHARSRSMETAAATASPGKIPATRTVN